MQEDAVVDGGVRDAAVPSAVVPVQHPAVLRVAVAAADQLQLQLLVHHVDRWPAAHCVGSTTDVDSLVVTCQIARPDLVLLRAHGLEPLRLRQLVHGLRSSSKPALVVIAPTGAYELASAALAAGVEGYVTDDADLERLDQVVDAVAAGEVAVDHAAVTGAVRSLVAGLPEQTRGRAPAALTARERQVLRLLVDGQSTFAIADTLSMSMHTARSHIKAILSKLGAHTRLEAAALAVQRQLV